MMVGRREEWNKAEAQNRVNRLHCIVLICVERLLGGSLYKRVEGRRLPNLSNVGQESTYTVTCFFFLGETSLTPLKFGHFCRYPLNVQNLSLRCIKLWFSLTLPIPYTKNSN
jgi:hypothetical protein